MRRIDRRGMLMTSLVASGAVIFSGERLSATELPKLGLIHPGPKGPIPSMEAVVAGLADRGYVDGETATIEYRYGENKREQLPELVRSLVDENVNIIIAVAGDALVEAASVTKTVPIVSA